MGTTGSSSASGQEAPEVLAEVLFGQPSLLLRAYQYGRDMRHRLERLHPAILTHSRRGIRSGINELNERGTAVETAGGPRQ
jgi:hypothetical protein